MRAQKSAAVTCAFILATSVAATPISAATHNVCAIAAPSQLTSAANISIPDVSPSTLDATDEARPDAANDVTDGAAKKKGDPLVRALTAPFRALARLFGGGKKSSREPDTAKAKDARKSDAATAARADQKHVDQKRTDQKTDRGQSVNVAAANVAPTSIPSSPSSASSSPASSLSAPLSSLPPSPPRPSSQPSPSSTPQPLLPLPQQTSSPTNAPTVATPGASVAQPPKENAPFTPLIVGVAGDPLSQGRALLERGYVTEAIRELSIAAATGSNLVEANNLLGLAHDLRGLHKQAQEFYERALSVAPNDARVINNLGYSLYLDDHYKESLAKLKLAARLDPSRPEIFNNLGFVCGRLGKYDDALRNFARAGGDFYARVQTATLLEAAGRDLDAIKHYEAARRIDPASTDVLRRLITLYNRTGQRDKAEAAERALDRPKTNSKSG